MEDLVMRAFDFTPYRRSTVGFDRLFDLLETGRREESDGYPPFDLETEGDGNYRITLAVAGFRPEEIEVTSKPNILLVTGRKAEDQERRYLHRGIATRAFERQFQLADYVVVTGASLEDGLLSISLKREVPEEVKPRRIEIGTGARQARLDVAENREAA
jgi:molecular chaperone IbpA